MSSQRCGTTVGLVILLSATHSASQQPNFTKLFDDNTPVPGVSIQIQEFKNVSVEDGIAVFAGRDPSYSYDLIAAGAGAPRLLLANFDLIHVYSKTVGAVANVNRHVDRSGDTVAVQMEVIVSSYGTNAGVATVPVAGGSPTVLVDPYLEPFLSLFPDYEIYNLGFDSGTVLVGAAEIESIFDPMVMVYLSDGSSTQQIAVRGEGPADLLSYGNLVAPPIGDPSDGMVAYPGNDGVYLWNGGTTSRVISYDALVPGTASMYADLGRPVISNGGILFSGERLDASLWGLYHGNGGDLEVVVAEDARVPNRLQYRIIGSAAYSGYAEKDGTVVFSNFYGLYMKKDGKITKVIDSGDCLDGKRVSSVTLADGFDGVSAGFTAEFEDGTQAIYVAHDVLAPAGPAMYFHGTGVSSWSRLGQDQDGDGDVDPAFFGSRGAGNILSEVERLCSVEDATIFDLLDLPIDNKQKLVDHVSRAKEVVKAGDTYIFYINAHGGFLSNGGGIHDEEPAVLAQVDANNLDARVATTGPEYLSLGTDGDVIFDQEFADLFAEPEWAEVNKLFIISSSYSGGFWGGTGEGEPTGLAALPRAALITDALEADFSWAQRVPDGSDELMMHGQLGQTLSNVLAGIPDGGALEIDGLCDQLRAEAGWVVEGEETFVQADGHWGIAVPWEGGPIPIYCWATDDFPHQLSLAPDLAGDYNGDGTVNAADYTVWRDLLGQAVALPNETATPGTVTQEDYDVWKANFGNTASSGLLSNATVPEPTSLLLFGLVFAGLPWRLSRRLMP